MRLRGIAFLTPSHPTCFSASIRYHSLFLIYSKILSQSRHIFARDTNSETVHRRSFQGRRSKNIGDVRPTELNLKPSIRITPSSLSMSSRNEIDLQTLHRDMTADAMGVLYGVLLITQLCEDVAQPPHNVTSGLASSSVQYCPMTDVTCKIVLNV